MPGSRVPVILGLAICLWVALFAGSCAPFPDATPTPLPSASTTLVPTAVPPTLPPTWTLLPTPNPSQTPTALPAWPTPGPTPTTAPLLRPAVQTAVYFFYWHDCPIGNCRSNIIYAVPPGWISPLPGDTDSRDGLQYSSLNRYWYFQELRDMRLAGVDIVLPVSWGDSSYPWFRTAVLQELAEANRTIDPPLRVGLFDDTTSEISEYSDYADNGAFDGSAYTAKGLPLDLSDSAAGFFFYDRKIKPFFQTIPQEMWATHDGRPLEEGGRPLIVVYMRQNIIHMEYAGRLWRGVKDAFARDFQDRNGQPITPFLVLETTWFSGEARYNSPSVDDVADGRYTWGAALLGPQWRTTRTGYTVSSIGVGFDDRKNASSTNRVQRRDLTPDGVTDGPGAFLEGSFSRIPTTTNLLLIETWNELYEGTNVSRAAYPEIAGQYVPQDYYIGLLRRLLLGQDLWWGAYPHLPSWPAHLEPAQSYRLAFPVENTGTRTWAAEEGVYLSITGDLFPAGYQALLEGPVQPGETVRFKVPLTAPAQEGSYRVAWQMVSPAGPMGPQVEWTLPVEAGAITTTLRVVEEARPSVGQPTILTIEIAPAARVAAVRLHLRFDPALLTLEGVQPLASRPRQWNVSVDNDRGETDLELELDLPELLGQLLQLRLHPRVAGQAGLWVELSEIKLEDGTVLSLPPQWVSLVVSPSP